MKTVSQLAGQISDLSLGFEDLGLDSLGKTYLVQQIRARLKLTVKDLNETTLYAHECSTIEGLLLYCLQINKPKPVDPAATAIVHVAAEARTCYIHAAACEYPAGVTSVGALLDFLQDGKDAITQVPSSRWDVDEYFSEDVVPGCMNTRHGAFLARDPFTFDAEYFSLAPREVKYMDPQQRLLLESAAGLGTVNSSTGVFVGAMTRDFGDELCKRQVLRLTSLAFRFRSLVSLELVLLKVMFFKPATSLKSRSSGRPRCLRRQRKLQQCSGWENCRPFEPGRSNNDFVHCVLFLLGSTEHRQVAPGTVLNCVGGRCQPDASP